MVSKVAKGQIKLTLKITDLIKLCWSDAEWPKYMKLLCYYCHSWFVEKFTNVDKIEWHFQKFGQFEQAYRRKFFLFENRC